MGQPSTHNTYVHLYINGLYWGLYDPAERPDDAFLAEHLGGDRHHGVDGGEPEELLTRGGGVHGNQGTDLAGRTDRTPSLSLPATIPGAPAGTTGSCR